MIPVATGRFVSCEPSPTKLDAEMRPGVNKFDADICPSTKILPVIMCVSSEELPNVVEPAANVVEPAANVVEPGDNSDYPDIVQNFERRYGPNWRNNPRNMQRFTRK